eukprot:CAMPEP_0202004126 /NCGR_PEP_ID=MMETSP0905-20130828/9515_1 /ASSEMBLY_ACC=CAM_ASM_000554 /TAXON_ID=420261 /ORGANISM="Thalassiosira antarctica, Strain CCMP982" /LENGTH=66 /DNA_ID=CAMNT_0048561387 /DNA_START=76 /DNA_END=272 /DNA_ORIENTATION=+
MSREAFLLSVPTNGPSGTGGSNYTAGIGMGSKYSGGTGMGGSKDTFVLALPEMAEQPREEGNYKPV